MPGRRLPQHRGNSVVGGGSPTLQGSLVLSDSALNLNITEGDYIEFVGDIFLLSNGGPGNWNNPQWSIAYSDATDWLSFSTGTPGPETFEYLPKVQAAGLSPSTQVATVTFTDSNVSNSGLQVVITVAVSASSPTMSAFPSSLSFSIVDETDPGTAQTTTISNATGLGTLATPVAGTVTGTGAAYIDSVGFSGPAGGPFVMTVTPTALAGTVGGPYPFAIPVSSSGALNSPISVTGSITVTSAQTAAIALDRTLDDAQFTVGGASPSSQVVGFRNGGTGTLAGVTIQSTSYAGDHSGWATPTLTANTLTVAIDSSGISTEGTSTFDVVLADANAAQTATYTVFLKSSSAVASPTISVSPGAIGITLNNGTNPTNRTVTIQNVNGSLAQLGTVTVGLVPGVAWCNIASVVNGVATLAFTTSGLANGSYSTSVQVAASLATNSPVLVPINVVVQAAPTPGAYPPAPRIAALPQGWTYDQNVGHPTGCCFNDGGYAGAADGAMPAFAGTVYAVPGSYTIGQVLTLLANGTIVDGDVVEIAEGTDLGAVQWPARAGWVEGTSGFVQIRSSGHASLPAYQGAAGPNKFTTDNRVKAAHASHLFTLSSSNANQSALLMQRSASGYWFTGVRFYNSFTSPTNPTGSIVTTGGHVGTSSSQSQLSHRPSHLVLDRFLIDSAQIASTRAIYAGATYCRILQGSMRECYKDNAEFQSILFLNGGDRTDILGCSMSGWGEQIYSGGGNPGIKDFSASDVMVLWNYIWHNTSHGGSPEFSDDDKNVFEVKSGWRFMYAFNMIDGACFKADQKFCFLSKATDQTEIVNGVKVQNPLFPAHTHDIIYWCNDLSRNIGKSFIQVTDNISDVFSSATIGTERIECAWNKHFWDTTVPAATSGHAYTPTSGDRQGINILKSQGDGVPGVHIYHNTFGAKQALWTCSTSANYGTGWSNIVVSDNVMVEAPLYAGVFGSSSGNNSTALNANFGAGVWDCRNNYIMPGQGQWDSVLTGQFGNGYLGSGGLSANFVDPTNPVVRDLTLVIPVGQPSDIYNGADGLQAGYNHTYMAEMLTGIEAD